MTAKTRHGKKAHPRAHGADHGTTHERLNKIHATPNRPEGAMHTSSPMPQSPPMAPQPADNAMAMAPPGAGPSAGADASDGDEGDQT